MSFGTLKDIDTRGSTASAIAVGDETWAAGDILFAHPTVDGKLTKVRPQHDLVVAFITVRHASAGQLAVRITSGNHLEWLHDVEVEDPTESQILAYDETAGLWKNIDIPPSAGVVTSSTPPEETSSIWFNTETGLTYIYYDSYWTSISGDSGAPIISDTAPSSPVVGMEWFNSSNGKSYIYYSNAWVELDSNGTTTASTGNVIINGAFEINQRGFTSTTSNGYGFDRWYEESSNGAVTYSSQAFTPGAAPVAGYEAKNFARIVTSGQTLSSAYAILVQKIEDVRTLAGQTATVSFWAKAGSGTPKIAVEIDQQFGTGGSPSPRVSTLAGQVTLSTSWARYSVTVAIPSLSGKTIGTDPNSSFTAPHFWFSSGSNFDSRSGSLGIQNNTFDIWGVQLESGPTATPFRRNAPSIQAELAACQRYYFASGFMNIFQSFIVSSNDTFRRANLTFPVTLRRVPTGSDISVSWSGGTPGLDSFTANQFRAYTAVGDSTTERVLTSFTVSVEL
jgi:hypothetical protein